MSELSVGTLSGLAANGYVIDVADGSSIAPAAGTILQVVSTTLTSAFSASVASSASTDITGLTATITPVSTSSKIMVTASVTIDAYFAMSVGLFRASTAIAIADASGARSRETSGASTSDPAIQASVPVMFLDSPSTTSATTYSFKIRNSQPTTSTLFVNRPRTLVDEARFANSVSTITLWEVAG
jgi:hypothetical protein